MGLWTSYGGSTKRFNLNRTQSHQSKIIGKILDAPFHEMLLTIHNDLKIPFIQDLLRSKIPLIYNPPSQSFSEITQFKHSSPEPKTPPQKMMDPRSPSAVISDVLISDCSFRQITY